MFLWKSARSVAGIHISDLSQCVYMSTSCWEYSSVVEHSTADREVPGAPSFSFFFLMKERSFFLLSESMYVIQWSPQWVSADRGPM